MPSSLTCTSPGTAKSSLSTTPSSSGPPMGAAPYRTTASRLSPAAAEGHDRRDDPDAGAGSRRLRADGARARARDEDRCAWAPISGADREDGRARRAAGNDRSLPAHLLRAGGDRRDAVPSSRFLRLASLDRRSAEMLGGLERAIQRFMDLDCAIAIERTLLAPDIGRCHSQIGTDRLGVWVPNTPGDLDFWLRQPVGQITSDRPDLALAIRGQLSAGADSPR